MDLKKHKEDTLYIYYSDSIVENYLNATALKTATERRAASNRAFLSIWKEKIKELELEKNAREEKIIKLQKEIDNSTKKITDIENECTSLKGKIELNST